MYRVIAISSLICVGIVAAAAGKAPAVSGPTDQQLYVQRCAACHGSDGAGGVMAPSLRGSFGRMAGRAPGFGYGAALRSANLKLDRVGLDSFLAAPSKRVPGTKMPVSVPDPTDRAAIIRHLETFK